MIDLSIGESEVRNFKKFGTPMLSTISERQRNVLSFAKLADMEE